MALNVLVTDIHGRSSYSNLRFKLRVSMGNAFVYLKKLTIIIKNKINVDDKTSDHVQLTQGFSTMYVRCSKTE